MSNSGKVVQERIRSVLMEHWDPIGISDVPECWDEYDSYIGGIYDLLIHEASNEEFVALFIHIEAGMGVGVPMGQLEKVIEMLRQLDMKTA